MPRIDSFNDPRIAGYRNLRDRTLRGESLFIAEGEVVAERLLASEYGAESLLVAEKFAEKFERWVDGRIPVCVAPESLLGEVVGFNFHRGVLLGDRCCDTFSRRASGRVSLAAPRRPPDGQRNGRPAPRLPGLV